MITTRRIAWRGVESGGVGSGGVGSGGVGSGGVARQPIMLVHAMLFATNSSLGGVIMQKNLNKNKKAGNKRKSNLTTSKKRSQSQTKKGALSKPVKKQGLKRQANEEVKITKIINAQNEGNFAGVAQNAGGKLSVLKAPLNFDSRSKSFGQKGAGKKFGASRK